MPAPLPFSDLLEALRKRGFDIGLAQYQDVARLCEQLGEELARDRRLLSRSLAGLLARNADEQATIERLFFEHYATAIYADQEIAKSQPDAVRQGMLRQEVVQLGKPRKASWRTVVLLALLGTLAMGGALAAYWKLRKPLEAKPTPPPIEEPKKTQTPPSEGPPGAPPAANPIPELGDPIQLFHYQEALRATLPLPLLLFALLYSLRRRRGLRTWAKSYWRAVRNDLGGAIEQPIDFAKLLPPALERGDLDDMATILGRSDDRPPSRELDGEKSVRATLSRGALPTLIFAQQPVARTVLVLCDVSSAMRLWHRKSEALCQGLLRRGVPLVVRYFDGDASRVSDRRHGRTQPLLDVQRQYPDAALLIISDGGKAHDINEPSGFAPWLTLGERFRLRAWLHPVLNKQLFRPVLRREDFPFRVLPMSRKGLLAAAYDLAQEPERRRHIAQADAASQRVATEDDQQRIKRLVPLWPDMPTDLAQYLVHRFHPDLPEETLLRVWASSQDMSGERLRFSESDLSAWFAELQEQDRKRQDPRLSLDKQIQRRQEERVRRELLRILRQHEPAVKGSGEHMQWRLRCALEQIYLHDPDDSNVNEALATLAELAQGPLWENVSDAVALLAVPMNRRPRGKPGRALAEPVRKKLQQQVLGLIRSTAGGKVRVPTKQAGQPISLPRRPGFLHIPTFLELALTMLALAVCAFAVYLKGIGRERIEHVEAYRIQRGPLGSIQSAHGGPLIIDMQGDGFPTQVTLCGDARCDAKVKDLVLSNGATATYWAASERADRYYHVRAQLPKGAWAYSKQVLVPGYVPPPAGELLVRFVSEEKPVSGVRFTATDATGKALTGEAEKRLSVRAGPVRVSGTQEPYPAFAKDTDVIANALRELTIDLGKPPPPPGMVEIPAGSFLMGSNDGNSNEKPVHRVTLPAFYLDQTEVSMAQYEECRKAGGCTTLAKTVKHENYSEEDVKKYSPFCNINQRGRAAHPVNCVDWNQAAAYCKWAGKHLPTEAEWEYAARGTDGRKYPWAGSGAPRAGLLNACGTECVEMATRKGWSWKAMYQGDDGWETTSPVGKVPGDKSPFGVLDLGGNVTEWVQNWYRDDYRKSSGPTNLRSLRGASWSDFDPTSARATGRFRFTPSNRYFYVGFRCARTK